MYVFALLVYLILTCEFLNSHVKEGGAFYDTHLSAILADLILSMTMTCLLQHIEVVRATPRLAPGVLATSTSRGPDAVATESMEE